MKPKTKLEKRVEELASTLKPVTDKQIAWGYDHCFEKQMVATKKKAYCLECGTEWQHTGHLHASYLVSSQVPTECPSCGKKLKVLLNKKRTDQDEAYYGILTTCKEFQVFRILVLKKYSKVGKPAVLSGWEVMQHWIHKSGKDFLRSASIFPMTFDKWVYGPLQLRNSRSPAAGAKQGMAPYKIYPARRILPEIKRNGFDGKFYGVSPTVFFHKLLSDPETETLLKNKQYSLLRHVLRSYPWRHNSLRDIDGIWSSVKICLRNNYTIESATLWIDYVKMLREFNKDLSSSHFVCPVDLKASHDKLVVKFRDRQRKKRIEEQRKELAESQQAYAALKGKFFGLAFTQGELTVKVLESVEEFMIEGDQLKHCVFASRYYKRPESLILSARVGDVPVETVEISLNSLQIVQARGLQNKPSPYHDEVVSLVTQNLPAIGKLLNK